MLRIVVAAGLILATFAPADARGFRFSFKSFGRASHGTEFPHVVPKPRYGMGVVVPAPRRREDPAPSVTPAATQAVRSTPEPAKAAPAAPTTMTASTRTAEASAAGWCDNGAIVGSGKGFCVLR